MANEVFTSTDRNNGVPQADPNNDLTITSSRVTFDTEARNIDAYFYRDLGVNHFDGDFEHLAAVQVNGGASGEVAFWVVSDVIDDFHGMEGSGYALVCLGYNVSYIYISEIRYSAVYYDGYNFGQGTPAYLTIERDEAAGANGTLYCYIYSDSARTNLVDTLSLTLHEKRDYRYLFTNCSYNSGSSSVLSGFIENLDIQEAGGEVEKTSSESASGEDAISADYPGAEIKGAETGGGEETVSQRGSAAYESGTGVDIAEMTNALTGHEYGSGSEDSVVSPVFLTDDTGLGVEICILIKDVHDFEVGEGEDTLKVLAGIGGKSPDMRLQSRVGRTGIPSKKTGMPSKGVNI